MADIQDLFQATLFFSIPVILIVFSITTLAFLILYHQSENSQLAPASDVDPLQPILPYHHIPTYRTFSDSNSSYAADDERSVRTGRRATASIVHPPTLPTIEDDTPSHFEESQIYESSENEDREENLRLANSHLTRLDTILSSPKDSDIAVLSPVEEDVGSGEDVPRGRVRQRIGSGGSQEIISRWLAPRWRKQSVDVEGQRSIGRRAPRSS